MENVDYFNIKDLKDSKIKSKNKLKVKIIIMLFL